MLDKIKKIILINFFILFTFIIAISPFVTMNKAYGTVEDLFSYVSNPFKTNVEPYGGKLIKKSYHKYNGYKMHYEIRSTHLSPTTVISSYESALNAKGVRNNVDFKTKKDISIGFGAEDNIVVVNAVRDDNRKTTLVQKTWRKSKYNGSCTDYPVNLDLQERLLNILKIEDDELRNNLMMDFLELEGGERKKNKLTRDVPGDDIESIERYPNSRRTNSAVYDAGKLQKVVYSNKFAISANESFYLNAMKRNGWVPDEFYNSISQTSKGNVRHLTFQKTNKHCDLFIASGHDGYTDSTFFVR